jgi:DedD protein
MAIQTDDELNIRRKARRRLIGAFALTLAVVVILPMVLDSEPKPSGQDIELRIPAADKIGEFVPGVAVSSVAEALPLAASAVAASPAPVAASAVPAVPAILAMAQAETAKPAAAATAAEQAPESNGTEQLAGTGSLAVQVGAYSNADTAKQEMLKLKKWGFKAYTEQAGDKIRVRVGPYTERDKVEKVRLLLEKHGLHPVVVSVR